MSERAAGFSPRGLSDASYTLASVVLAGAVAVAALLTPTPARAGEKLDRGLVALRRADGTVYLGWRLLADDPPDIAFHVYRGPAPGQTNERLNREPIRDGTNFVSPAAPKGEPLRLHYYCVRAVVAGTEGPPSPLVVPADTPPGASYLRIKLNADYTAQKVALGDLDGDGRYDYVIKQPDFNVDPYEAPGYWEKSQDTYKIEAYRSDGQFLWRHDMGWSIEEGIWYSPYVVYDLDGDGRAEVYTKAGEGDPRDADGRVQTGPEWLVQLDGATGQVKRKLPWPDRLGYEKYNYYCRNLLGVAYLDGRRPHLIVERGTYSQIKVEAYDGQLNLVWRWNSQDEKELYSGRGMHGMHAADVDGDGRDEIVIGAAVLDDTGRGLWTLGAGHPDACYVGDIDPQRPGLEIFYGIEPGKPRDAVCLVDARTGTRLWGCDEPTKHVHAQGMVADILPEHPGQECYAGEKDGSRYWLYSATGRRIGDQDIGGLAPRAAFWDADPQKELVLHGRIGRFQGPADTPVEGDVTTIADCLGDWREEVITSLPGEVRIYSTMIPAATRRTCLMQDRLYRLDVAVASMGYFSPPQLSAAPETAPATAPARLGIGDRASCSSLCQARQPLDKALQTIADLGYRWVDLSCLSWAPHASVPELLKDFEREASRVEAALAAHRLKVSNLTFDAIETRPFDEYQRQFEAVVKLAARLKARLINIMAPSKTADRQDQVQKLRTLVAVARAAGVLLTVETHCNQVTELPADAAWLCQQVPGLGLTLDPSHYYAGPNQGAGFEQLYPLTQGTGFRAGGMIWDRIQLPWGQGPIDFAQIVRALEAGGYKGFYVSEYIEGFNQLDAVAESRGFLEWARGL